MSAPLLTNAAGCVYFIREGTTGRIKIGKTTQNPDERMRALQTGNPERLRLIVTMPGYTETEARLHKRFRHLMLVGEWFNPAPELVSFIEGAAFVLDARRVERACRSAEPPPPRPSVQRSEPSVDDEVNRRRVAAGAAAVLEALASAPDNGEIAMIPRRR